MANGYKRGITATIILIAIAVVLSFLPNSISQLIVGGFAGWHLGGLLEEYTKRWWPDNP